MSENRAGAGAAADTVTRRGSTKLRGVAARSRDWAWRRYIRQQRGAHRVYRVVIAALGLLIVLSGLVLVPLPGPGWLIVFLGIAVWASEFHWARRLHQFGTRSFRTWSRWMLGQPLWLRGVVTMAGFLLVAVAMWAVVKLLGLPDWTPAWAATFLHSHAGL